MVKLNIKLDNRAERGTAPSYITKTLVEAAIENSTQGRAQRQKNPPASTGDRRQGSILGPEDSLEEDILYSSVLACKIHRQRTWWATVHVVTTDQTWLSTQHMLTECMNLFLCLPISSLWVLFVLHELTLLFQPKGGFFPNVGEVLQQFSPYFSSQMTLNTTRILFSF